MSSVTHSLANRNLFPALSTDNIEGDNLLNEVSNAMVELIIATCVVEDLIMKNLLGSYMTSLSKFCCEIFKLQDIWFCFLHEQNVMC